MHDKNDINYTGIQYILYMYVCTYVCIVNLILSSLCLCIDR